MMRAPDFRYHAARSVADAARALRDGGPEAMLIAGGTDLVPNMKRRQQTPTLVVGIRQLRELKRIRKGKFIGAKVYLNLSPAYIPQKEIRVFDFLPPHQLDTLNRLRAVVMLHIPRDGRLRDPVNLAQMLEIERNWPRVRLIIAHVGRAYCDEDIGDAFETLKATKNMVVDFSANTHDRAFEGALRAFGPERCLFGSDMPITRMRMRRVCEDGRYINIVPRGLYGDVSGDRNMREVAGQEADALTFFMYEEIKAIRRAVERVGLGRSDVEALFCSNARRFLSI